MAKVLDLSHLVVSMVNSDYTLFTKKDIIKQIKKSDAQNIFDPAIRQKVKEQFKLHKYHCFFYKKNTKCIIVTRTLLLADIFISILLLYVLALFLFL